MKKQDENLLFDKNFKEEISRESIENIKRNELGRAWMTLVVYALKFKQKGVSEDKARVVDFLSIKKKSLELYRQKQTPFYKGNRYSKIAVVATFLLLFAMGGYFLGQVNIFSDIGRQSEIIEFKTSRGQQSELTLPDGTFVTLNYDSKLRYRIASNKKLQEVELEGEAFFKVTKNKSRIFRVITESMNVNVLGTEFDVKAYKEDQKTETTLLEGSIEIKDIPGYEGSVLLKPGEKWSYARIEKRQAIDQVDPSLSALWRNGEYYFEEVSLGELAKTLERMYKVNIHFEDFVLKNEIYTGSVFQRDDIRKLFEIINLTVPIDFNIEKDEIWIKRK